MSASPVTSKVIRGVRFFVKRDDLRLATSGISGNKARKFAWLEKLVRTPEFPSILASEGGLQSNALGALARLLDYHNSGTTGNLSSLVYMTPEVPPAWLVDNPICNFKTAVETSGVEIRPSRVGADSKSSLPKGALWIPQGGALEQAKDGVFELVDECIRDIETMVKQEKDNDELLNRPWIFIIASGTGTIAYYSHLRLRQLKVANLQVCTIPCVGSQQYLEEQISNLTGSEATSLPRILSPRFNEQFAAPRRELWEIWNEISDPSCVFDLVYAPRTFEVIFENLEELSKYNLLVYGCGGVEGNEAMLARYRRMGISSNL